MLKITISIRNISSSVLINLVAQPDIYEPPQNQQIYIPSCSAPQNEITERYSKRILSVTPQRVVMKDLRPKEIVHQVLYISEFSSEYQFVPLKIAYGIEETNVYRTVVIPIATDISKFLIKQKPQSLLAQKSPSFSRQNPTTFNKIRTK